MKPVRTLLLTAALGLTVAACGTGGPAASKRPATASATAFVLQEWSIDAPTTQLRAGKVSVTATNTGSETHELVIVRASSTASLPTKPDGSVDEDKIAEADKPDHADTRGCFRTSANGRSNSLGDPFHGSSEPFGAGKGWREPLT